MIPRLLVVFTRQLEILVTAMHTLIVPPPPVPKTNKQTKQTKQNITKQIRLIADYNPLDGLYGEVPPKRDTFSSNGPLINIFRTDPPYGRIIIIF